MGEDARAQSGDPAAAREMAAAYDAEAEASGWHGPEVAFGLAFRHVQSGQSVVDLGIGTGLAAELFRKAGLDVHGLDVDQDMLDASRTKGFDNLVRHDLTDVPYPYPPGRFDHAVCTGVLNFLADPSPVFLEVARIIRSGGVFAFITGDRDEAEPHEIVVRTEEGGGPSTATLYRHSLAEVRDWLGANGLVLEHTLVFLVPLRREPGRFLVTRACLARKGQSAAGS